MSALDYLLSNQIAFVSCFILLGLLVGSFLNVVIYRLPKMMELAWHQEMLLTMEEDERFHSLKAHVAPLRKQLLSDEPFNLAVPASRCPHCGHQITALENIPVVSYLLLGGKCKKCGSEISARYPLVEFITGALSGVVALYFFASPLAAGLAVLLTWCLIALTGIDYDTYLLPDSITLPLLWLGLIVNYFGVYTSLTSALLGAVFGYLSLWSVYWLFKLTTGKEGMGFGDFKLLAALGAWMGWQMLPAIIIMSSLVGAVIGIAMILFGNHEKSKPIPFGPYLAVAGWITLLCGNAINAFYLDYVGLS